MEEGVAGCPAESADWGGKQKSEPWPCGGEWGARVLLYFWSRRRRFGKVQCDFELHFWGVGLRHLHDPYTYVKTGRKHTGSTHLREDASSSSPPVDVERAAASLQHVASHVSPCPAPPLHATSMAPPPPVELIPEIQHVIKVDDMEVAPWPYRCSRHEVIRPLLSGELLLAEVNPLAHP
jgi:hypothetical protein